MTIMAPSASVILYDWAEVESEYEGRDRSSSSHLDLTK